jgi:hypothetical protein
LNQLLKHNHINQSGIEGTQMRPLTTFIIAPSVHLSDVAKQHQKDMPALIHYFLSSLGRDAASCSDLMSYLLFTPQYTRELIEIGYHDTSKRIDEIEDFSIRPRRETLKTHWPVKREGMCRSLLSSETDWKFGQISKVNRATFKATGTKDAFLIGRIERFLA